MIMRDNIIEKLAVDYSPRSYPARTKLGFHWSPAGHRKGYCLHWHCRTFSLHQFFTSLLGKYFLLPFSVMGVGFSSAKSPLRVALKVKNNANKPTKPSKIVVKVEIFINKRPINFKDHVKSLRLHLNHIFTSFPGQ